MGINAADLAAARATVNAFQPDTATNSRTSATTSCFIHDQPKLLLIERGFRVRSYQIDVPYGTDYVAGDTLTLGSSQGVFAVQQTLTPLSHALELQLVCVPTSLKLASYMAVETATFRHPTILTQTVTAPLYVVDLIHDVEMFGSTPAYRWMVIFENSLRYPNGGQVGANHELALASLFGSDSAGTARSAPISRPRPILHALPFMAAYVKELA